MKGGRYECFFTLPIWALGIWQDGLVAFRGGLPCDNAGAAGFDTGDSEAAWGFFQEFVHGGQQSRVGRRGLLYGEPIVNLVDNLVSVASNDGVLRWEHDHVWMNIHGP